MLPQKNDNFGQETSKVPGTIIANYLVLLLNTSKDISFSEIIHQKYRRREGRRDDRQMKGHRHPYWHFINLRLGWLTGFFLLQLLASIQNIQGWQDILKTHWLSKRYITFFYLVIWYKFFDKCGLQNWMYSIIVSWQLHRGKMILKTTNNSCVINISLWVIVSYFLCIFQDFFNSNALPL